MGFWIHVCQSANERAVSSLTSSLVSLRLLFPKSDICKTSWLFEELRFRITAMSAAIRPYDSHRSNREINHTCGHYRMRINEYVLLSCSFLSDAYWWRCLCDVVYGHLTVDDVCVYVYRTDTPKCDDIIQQALLLALLFSLWQLQYN